MIKQGADFKRDRYRSPVGLVALLWRELSIPLFLFEDYSLDKG
jgi:hypothetical protein